MDPVPPVPVPPPPPTPVMPSPTPSKVRLPFLIVLGIAVVASGSVIAYTQLGLFQPTKLIPSPQPVAAISLSPTPQPLFLTLTSPKSDELAVNQEVLIKGQTAPNATVIIYSESDEVITQSDASGNFEATTLLAQGSNSLVITAFSDTGEETSLNLDITYSP